MRAPRGEKRAAERHRGENGQCSDGSFQLRRFAMIVLEQAVQARVATDVDKRNQVGLPLSLPAAREQQLVVLRLVGPLGMVMLEKIAAQVVPMPLSEHREVIGAFLLDALHKPLDEGHLY